MNEQNANKEMAKFKNTNQDLKISFSSFVSLKVVRSCSLYERNVKVQKKKQLKNFCCEARDKKKIFSETIWGHQQMAKSHANCGPFGWQRLPAGHKILEKYIAVQQETDQKI